MPTYTWARYDQYRYSEKASRLILLKWLILGRFTLSWFVPATNKDKQLHLEGKRV